MSNLQEKNIVKYLLDNPDFLDKNPTLLQKLNIRHKESTGLSLLEKQVDVLRDQSEKNQQYLQMILRNVGTNQNLVEGIIGFSALLQTACTLEEALETINTTLVRYFPIAYYALHFIKCNSSIDTLSAVDAKIFTNLINSKKVQCGIFTSKQAEVLFGKISKEISSMALIPIVSTNSSAVMALASKNKGDYTADKGVEFLDYLKIMISSTFERFGKNA